MLMVGIVLWAVQKGWTRAHFMCDRALAISAAVAIWLNTYDIPSFDSRNNMLGWLLLTTCLTISSNNINPPESLHQRKQNALKQFIERKIGPVNPGSKAC